MTTGTHGVVFSTSLAVPLQRKKTTLASTGNWLAGASRIVAASMRRIFVKPMEAARPTRKSGPERYRYLERSLMAREIYRL